MRHLSFAVIVLTLAGFASTARAEADRPVPPPADAKIKRAVVISIDGLRPDLLIRARTPNIHALIPQASFSFWARTTEVSVTLPSHTSMMTGMVPERHGINFNNDGPEEQIYPTVPTLFAYAGKAGYTTALISGKSKFSALAAPGTVDWVKLPGRGKTFDDRTVAANAVQVIGTHAPEVMLVHFPGNDVGGHKFGWGTPEQIAALENIDTCVGLVLDALREKNLFDQTLVILTADHGGQGKSHGKDDFRSRYIPWIAVGPGLHKDLDLTRFKELVINTEDTFATVCYFLSIPHPSDIDGKPVRLVEKDLELMSSTPATPATKPAGRRATTRPAAAAAAAN
jgi:arylsulfatase A-like enzyme